MNATAKLDEGGIPSRAVGAISRASGQSCGVIGLVLTPRYEPAAAGRFCAAGERPADRRDEAKAGRRDEAARGGEADAGQGSNQRTAARSGRRINPKSEKL